MTTLVSPDYKMPPEVADQAARFATAELALRQMHQQQTPALEYLLAVLEFRRDVACEAALRPTATKHERGRADEANALVKEVANILGMTAN
jgi:hypothetical protein